VDVHEALLRIFVAGKLGLLGKSVPKLGLGNER